MALIPMGQVIHKIEYQLKNMAIQEAIEVKTYKKDRGFILHRSSEQEFTLVQFGYQNQTITTVKNEIKKACKKALKVEFPRSNQAWVQYYQGVEDPTNIKPHHQQQMALF